MQNHFEVDNEVGVNVLNPYLTETVIERLTHEH